ncbi:MAG: type II secretion system protein [Phycisphaerales bacterium]|nr:type II secretion system protein [Phycisphaerales bacterium]
MRRAFSMIEVLVVILILAILAGVMAPRLATFTALRVEPTARRAGDVLSIAGRRDRLSSQRVAVDYADGVLRMLVLLPATDGRGSEWREDPLAPPVDLGPVMLVSARLDGVELDTDQWRVELAAAGRRPSLTLLLSGPGEHDPWTVELAPEGASAEVRRGWSGQGLSAGAVELEEQSAW